MLILMNLNKMELNYILEEFLMSNYFQFWAFL